MDAAELRARLAAPGRGGCGGVTTAPLAGDDVRGLDEVALVPAAVLVPLVLGAAPGVLLTKRTAHLSKHPGQVSFPGGRIDPHDADAEAAALRETKEEIGLDPASVEIVGRLDNYITGTGYRITPVVGLLPPGVAFAALRLCPSVHEVEHVFELPLSVLLDPAAPQRRSGEWRGRRREFWVWPHPDHYIWGATAGILINLAARLKGKLMRWAELALFLVPFALYAAWRVAAATARPALAWGTLACVVVLAGATVWFGVSRKLDRHAAYVPARIEDGRIVPGHAAP